jgi:hypothetical protein
MPPNRNVRPYLRRDFGRITTETPYNATWVDAIKRIIPHACRKHEGGSLWSFDPRYYACVKTITEHFMGSIIDSTGGVSEPQISNWREPWEAYKAVMDSADDELRKAQQRMDDRAREHRERHAPPRRGSTSNAFATLYLAENAPKQVVTAAFRALAAVHHPDKGGDAETMARINAAYDELKKYGRA